LTQRRVGRLLGVHHQSVVNWFHQAAATLTPEQAPRPQGGDDDTGELDELFTFVGDKKRSLCRHVFVKQKQALAGIW
jgi:hypothetical protein